MAKKKKNQYTENIPPEELDDVFQENFAQVISEKEFVDGNEK